MNKMGDLMLLENKEKENKLKREEWKYSYYIY